MGNWQVNRDDYSVTMDLGPDCEWVAEMQWPEGVTQGGPAVLVIYPSNPDTCPLGGLSQTVLREVDFKYALDRLRSYLSTSKRWDAARKKSEQRVTAELVAHSDMGLTPEYLVLLSRVYVGAVNQGQSKPLEYLAELTGKTPAAIKNHLWQATRKGYLERSPGRAGGHLTAKAAEIMETIIPSGLESLGDTYRRLGKSP
ncbi:MarR family winged helix-turn-helix transcriptional regulator [Mycobacteroides abscessus]|uniref:MarR family winged helix-turn-helix transcriptional regulator n=1 Tax=Mycobacteroides abscessus TaxID=36809 RepID=UPI000C25A471|nr:MarR family winged helix-turn-helix transcriptional regulator [Mycobacteroides abscessus]RIR96408.1 MarR family transcriptional regulator [Mycobacteroides abscessus]RIU31847.1 MarR family transcriptional regulator [Mycobacteroides abscessus]